MSNGKKISIAIDGPAGSGKSTTAKLVAKELGLQYIDTGAMYRAVALKVLRTNTNPDDIEKISKLVKNIDIQFKNENDKQRIFLDNEDVTELIRDPEVTNLSSPISALQPVREAMVALQKSYGKNGGVVMEGRDIGTVVMPQAEVKIFLIASLYERTKRRHLELQSKGVEKDFYELEKEILARDVRDSTREISPLTKAQDAIEIDTTNLSIEEQVKKIVTIAKERTNK
ncbi:MAG TPA: (d)CMP kinase [Bacteroidota bacterium]|nr:(d)CMP kinase [Bacteroidota bacterium]